MTTLTPPSTVPPPSGIDVPIAVQGFVTDPKLVGYQVLTNYESTYWAPLVGNEAWRLYEVLRSFCHEGHNTCHPSIRLLTAILGLQEKRVLTGWAKTINGKIYRYPGSIEILQAHQLLVTEMQGEGPKLRYLFHVNLTPGLLNDEQLARLPSILQKKHAELLERCAAARQELEAKRRPSKFPEHGPFPTTTSPPVEVGAEGGGNLPPGGGNLPSGGGNLPPKQHPINTTHLTTPRARDNHNNNGDKPDDVVVAMLTHQGISEKVADRLTRHYNRARIEEKIAYLEYLRAEDPEKVKNPRGWLRRAIEEDYGPPDGYLPKAERERRAAEAAQHAQEEEERAKASEAARQAFHDQVQAQQEAARQALYAQYGTTQREIDLWQQMLEELRMQLGEATYHAYVDGALLLSVQDDRALIGLANPAVKDWVENRLAKPIQNYLARRLAGRKVTLQFVNLGDSATPFTDEIDEHPANAPVAGAA